MTDPVIIAELKDAYEIIVNCEKQIKELVKTLPNWEDDCTCETISKAYTIVIREDQIYNCCLQCGGMILPGDM